MAQGWLGCGRATQQARRAEIFVDVRPMEAEACAADPPVFALGFRGVEEPWVPDEGDDDGSPVDQVYGESIGSEVNVFDSLSRSNFRTVHSMPPSVFSRVPLIVAVRGGVRPH